MDITTLIYAAIVILVTYVAKHYGFDQKKVTLVLAGLLAIVFYFFKTLVPVDLQAQIITAITSIV